MFINDLLDLATKKKRNEERAKVAVRFAVGMGIAAAVGLARGILFAPKSGKETREVLKKKAADTVETLKGKVRKTAGILKDSAVESVQELHDAVSLETAKERAK